jgi:hypothetical protein
MRDVEIALAVQNLGYHALAADFRLAVSAISV